MRFSLLGHWRESRLRSYSDAVLCEECLAGSEEAWSVLLERYQNLIYSIPLKFHFSTEETAEIFQAVVLDLVTGLEKLREREKLQHWLVAVARHRCIRYKERRQVEPLTEEEAGRTLEELPDDRRQAEAWMMEAEQEQVLREAIGRVSRRCQELIHLLFYTDPAPEYRELAERLGVAKNSIGFIRDRCLKKLRAVLEEQGFEKRDAKTAGPDAGGRGAAHA
jgi:RNA polymerase sigma factor (sigma-70 family)